jgi:hypothetical protein
VERLWRDVKRREQVDELVTVPTLPTPEKLQENSTLRALNLLWDIPIPSAPPAEGQSLKGRAKYRLAAFVLGLLQPYFEEERNFRARSVQMLNTYAGNEDALAAEIRQVADALQTEARRLADRSELLHSLLEQRLDELQQGIIPGS